MGVDTTAEDQPHRDHDESNDQEHPDTSSMVLHDEHESQPIDIAGLGVEEVAKRIVANVMVRAVHRYQVTLEGRIVSLPTLHACSKHPCSYLCTCAICTSVSVQL